MFDVSPVAASLPPSDYIQPNFGHGLRIWWAFWWPTTLVTVALTIVANAILRRMYDEMLLQGNLVRPILQYDSYFFAYAVAFLGMMYILRRNFRRFRIGLLSNYGGEGAERLRPTLRRTARIWWTYSWRSLVYRLILGFVSSFPLGWLIGFLLAVINLGPGFATFVWGLVAIAIDAAVGMFVIYSYILDEDISDFRVALLPRTAPAGLAAIPAAPANPANS